jgi:hypothetical protein
LKLPQPTVKRLNKTSKTICSFLPFPLPRTHTNANKTTNSQMRARITTGTAALLLVLLLLQGSAASGGDFGGDYSKLSGIIIPGFASTQLRAWSVLDCPYSPLDFNPLDLVWLDSTKVCSTFCYCLSILADLYRIELKKKLVLLLLTCYSKLTLLLC